MALASALPVSIPVTIHIDMREKDIATLFAPGEATIENLELGDIQLRYADSTFLFERKTAADLAASIKDGRWHEQKRRVLAHIPAHRVAYLIEGYSPTRHLGHKTSGLSNEVFMGAFISSMFRDGIHVIFTNSVEDSVRWVRELAVRLNKDPSKFCQLPTQPMATAMEAGGGAGGGGSQPQPPYIDCLKVKKRKCENIDLTTCYQLQLCQIPSVSIVLAKAITEVYPGMRELMAALTDAIDKEALLTKIPLIGKKKATQILQFLGF